MRGAQRMWWTSSRICILCILLFSCVEDFTSEQVSIGQEANSDQDNPQKPDTNSDSQSKPENLEQLTIRNKTFFVELALTSDEHRRGLMFRDSLPSDQGMLFIFPDSQFRSFWMQNTFIDLSIAYISADGIIVDILDMKAEDLTPVPSSAPVQFALEVNEGALAGVYPGDKVDFGTILGDF